MLAREYRNDSRGTFFQNLSLCILDTSPPAPDAGAAGVHNDVSPVLAQTFTEPFVVFSAKRFPGVPGKQHLFPAPESLKAKWVLQTRLPCPSRLETKGRNFLW
jgi:hypothetical protein